MLRSNRLEGRRFLMLEQMGSSSHGMDKTWAGAWITQPQLQKNRQSLFMLLLPRKLFPPCSSHSKPLLTLPTPYLGLILFLICLKKTYLSTSKSAYLLASFHFYFAFSFSISHQKESSQIHLAPQILLHDPFYSKSPPKTYIYSFTPFSHFLFSQPSPIRVSLLLH